MAEKQRTLQINDKESLNAVLSSGIERLDSWIQNNGYAGWDPYDLKETPFFIGLLKHQKSSNVYRALSKVLFAISDFFPLLTRRIFKVAPAINAKSMGLLLTSYSNLYMATHDAEYLEKAKECAKWLLVNRDTKYTGYNWGYPFDWQSVQFIPEGIPSSVVTATVGDGFFHLYKATNVVKYLTICKDICAFFLKNLNITYDDGAAICYSYTPIDDYQVHNANLFVGEFLSRIGKEIKSKELLDRGTLCGNFALREQQPQGFLPYWGLSQTDSHSGGRIRTDHYHSGFEIRMLFGLWKHTGDVRFKDSYEKYFKWYLKEMFVDNTIPKQTPDSFYPVNIHSCAESILCQATLLSEHRERERYLYETLMWVLRKMEFAPGQYTYLIKDIPLLGEWKVNIPMIRWGQAWMMRALTELLITENSLVK